MNIFRLISALLSLYSLLCLFRIILTWIPGISYSSPASLLARICDPYLNLFRGIRWLRFGSFDFGPAAALCILGALSSVFTTISNTGKISLSFLLSIAIEIIFAIASSLLTFLIILFVIRLIVILINRDSYNQSSFMLNQIDSSIAPLAYKIAKTFSIGKPLTYKSALIISIVVLIALQFVLRFLITLILKIIFL